MYEDTDNMFVKLDQLLFRLTQLILTNPHFDIRQLINITIYSLLNDQRLTEIQQATTRWKQKSSQVR